jgi:hypothetical protein
MPSLPIYAFISCVRSIYSLPSPTANNKFNDNCVLLGCYEAGSANFLPTFRKNLSVPSARVKNIKGSLKSRNKFNGFYRFLEDRFLGGYVTDMVGRVV